MGKIILEIENFGNNWNDFILLYGGSFLQSYEWGEFQKSVGRKIHRLKNDLFEALISEINLPFKKKYFYCPRGPIFFDSNISLEKLNLFFADIKKIAKKDEIIFLRVDSEILVGEGAESLFEGVGFKKAFKDVQPRATVMINLEKSLEDILSAMHQKTRYNIKLSQKQELKFKLVEFKSEDFLGGFERFWELMQKTTERDSFRSHPKEYYKKLLEFIPDSWLSLAEYKDKIVAANIIIFFGGTLTYLHGAADYEFRNLMAPHFLHWEQIIEAKKRRCIKYDFWGIDEEKWPTLTRFKKSFGGEKIEYIGAWDLIFNRKFYTVYKLASLMRK